ncbi:hypothetical protein [Streptomyces beijiangensis]|uniref:Uncharacterized protein n=1 Tax=Streptomyces beijiangensis TaxID=163361 RepID=A0A939FAM6_9ACTN|nr:hypothetical protein [Streptomyces beijiangensis]MBO0515038.1 hypothetical protein [Streptomyces beijiangensis]
MTVVRATPATWHPDDIDHAVRLLAATPTHEGRDPDLLRQWALTATEFGASLPATPCHARIVQLQGGLDEGLLARYTSRPAPTLTLFTDSVQLAERVIAENGWRDWYPPGSVRAAALAHEAVHAQLHHGPHRARLKRALGHVVLRFGRRRVYGHVAGTEEIAAHAYAQVTCGLGRSPLVLTTALSEHLNLPPLTHSDRREN